MAKYLKVKAVKEIGKSNNKQLSANFIVSLDAIVERIIRASCNQDNCKRVTPIHIPSKFHIQKGEENANKL